MDAIEKAIRNAFEKGDPEDRAFRERVYRSAYAAMQKAIETNPNIDDAGAAMRRDLFKRRVVEIEQEFVPAVEAPSGDAREDDAAPHVNVEATLSGFGTAPEADIWPERDTEIPRARRPQRQDQAGELGALAAREEVDRRVRKRERRRPFAMAFILVTLLAALIVGGWWGASVLFGRVDGSVPNPPLQTESEDFQPDGQSGTPPPVSADGADADRDWITIFDPADPTRVQAPAGTRAEVVERDGESLLRVGSNTEGAAISFDIGEGTLQRLAGTRAVFSLDVSGEEGGETQISVECDFGALGDCGRRRYIIGLERGEYLFELDLPQGTPTGAGTISINPDITNAGRQLDIYQIRAAPAS